MARPSRPCLTGPRPVLLQPLPEEGDSHFTDHPLVPFLFHAIGVRRPNPADRPHDAKDATLVSAPFHEKPGHKRYDMRRFGREVRTVRSRRIKKGDVGENRITSCRPVSLLRCAKVHRTADGAVRPTDLRVHSQHLYSKINPSRGQAEFAWESNETCEINRSRFRTRRPSHGPTIRRLSHIPPVAGTGRLRSPADL